MLTTLTSHQIDRIHEATLRILDETGIVLDHPGARSLLLDHGAREDGGRVCLPAELVKRCLALCPPTVTLQGRGGNATLGDGALHVHNLGGARRCAGPARRRDAPGHERGCGCQRAPAGCPAQRDHRDADVHAAGCSAEAMTLVMFAETVRNTTKPINGPGVQTADEARLLFEMLQIVFGERPQVSVGISPVSPLTFPADNTGAILEVARLGAAVWPAALSSGRRDRTHDAGGRAGLAERRESGRHCAGAACPPRPAHHLLRAAGSDGYADDCAAVGQPGNGANLRGDGATGASLRAAGQRLRAVHHRLRSGYAERLRAGHQRDAAGAGRRDEISGIGEMGGGVLSCPAQMVIDDEIAGAVQRLRRGFAVDDETLAVELTRAVMDGDRNYLAQRHTVQHMRGGEVWMGNLAVVEGTWNAWREAGRPTATENAHERAQHLLSTHRVPPLAEDQDRALKQVIMSVN
ncbi:MAG: trimethylamine methyltransferase family protein [Anaerolineales bacterium]|nr:trimethylamine methyltransferase family protein [Anaerolineales bacterium]